MKELRSDSHEKRPVGRRSRVIALLVLGAAVLSAAALSATRFASSSASQSGGEREKPYGTREPSLAEVRAGLREAPRDASPLQQMFLALTAEGGLFEADLAESFGPEQAERIWHSFPCAKTVQ